MLRRFRVFVPILAGATLRDRILACVGALIAISLTGLLCRQLLGGSGSFLPLIVAPMGASAVLLFAVPASPLAQPWSIIGGNTISALAGVAMAKLFHDPAVAIGMAVSLAIFAMSFTRCLHPPGGAAALTAVIGGPAVAAAGWTFPFAPVALNSIVLVALGLVFHKLARRSYPHRPPPADVNTHKTLDLPPQIRAGFRSEDVDAALRTLNETFDVDRADVARLLQQVELEAAVRTSGHVTCGEIMSRDIVTVGPTDDVETARSLLLVHKIRSLPVIEQTGELLGIISLRELALAAGTVADCVAKAATASADAPAVSLVPALTASISHSVVIIDADRRVLGLITQTDLLVAMMRTLALS